MTNPLFSIIVPTFGRPELLQRAVASVCRQTFRDFELVIVDDASPEPVAPIVESSGIELLLLIRQPANQGNAAARNAGIRSARGSWMAFLDDDDELEPNFLERTWQTISETHPQPGWTWCGAVIEDDYRETEPLNRSLWRPSFSTPEEAYLGFLASRKIGTCGLCVRRECFDRVGRFDERLRAAVDTDFLIRLVRAYPFAVVPEPLVRIHRHGGTHVRRNMGAQAQAYRRIMAKHARVLREHPVVAAQLYYKTGWLHYHAGEGRWGRRYMLRALRRRRWSIRPWIALAIFELLGPLAAPLHLTVARLKKRLGLRAKSI